MCKCDLSGFSGDFFKYNFLKKEKKTSKNNKIKVYKKRKMKFEDLNYLYL